MVGKVKFDVCRQLWETCQRLRWNLLKMLILLCKSFEIFLESTFECKSCDGYIYMSCKRGSETVSLSRSAGIQRYVEIFINAKGRIY